MGKIPCCDKDGLKKGPWTPEEDQKLMDYIKKHGHGRWRTLPKNAGLKRCGKSCRLRWTNYLRPDIKRGRFSHEEEEIIIQLHSVLGNKVYLLHGLPFRWSAIAARLPGRTDNEIKNYWNTSIRKRLLKLGIDPITHIPRLDVLELSSLLSSTLYNSSFDSLNRVPNYLLGNMGALAMNQNLLNLATTLLSHQPPKSSTSANNSTTPLGFVSQSNVQDNNNLVLDDDLVPQNQLQSFQPNQFQNQTYTNHMNETQLMQAKMEPLTQSLMRTFSTSTTSSTCTNNFMWKNNVQDQAFTNPPESFFVTESSPGINSSSENQAFVPCDAAPIDIANTTFASLLSTPLSSPYVNYSCSTNTSHEEERDSFCSNMFEYDIANFSF